MTMAAAILRDEPNLCVDKTAPIEIRSSNAGLNLPQPTWRCNTGLSDITLYYGPEYHPAGKPQRRAVGAFSEARLKRPAVTTLQHPDSLSVAHSWV